jgi:hypothetical protein
MPRYSPPPPWPPMPRKLGPSAPGPLSFPLSTGIVPPRPCPLGSWFVPRGRPPSGRGSWSVVRSSCPRGRRPRPLDRVAWPPAPAPGVESRHRFPPRVGRGPRRAPREPRAKGAKALARFQTNIYRSKVNWLVVANMFHVKHPPSLCKIKVAGIFIKI